MPLLTIHHKTEYRYDRPVAFGEHRIMLRPRDGHDLRVLAGNLEIEPKPASRAATAPSISASTISSGSRSGGSSPLTMRPKLTPWLTA